MRPSLQLASAEGSTRAAAGGGGPAPLQLFHVKAGHARKDGADSTENPVHGGDSDSKLEKHEAIDRHMEQHFTPVHSAQPRAAHGGPQRVLADALIEALLGGPDGADLEAAGAADDAGAARAPRKQLLSVVREIASKYLF